MTHKTMGSIPLAAGAEVYANVYPLKSNLTRLEDMQQAVEQFTETLVKSSTPERLEGYDLKWFIVWEPKS